MRAALSLMLLFLVTHAAITTAQTDSKYPFRTDSANQSLPWFKLNPGVFPPHHSEHSVAGELVEADYIHRSGVFRTEGTGVLVNFTLPPYGSVQYLNAEADLRDVPIGTRLNFSLYQDSIGAFSLVADMQDEFSLATSQGLTYRLDDKQLQESRLLVTRHGVSKTVPGPIQSTLMVDTRTRVWKGKERASLSDLATGDELLFNFTGGSGKSLRRCTDIWAGAIAPRLATEQQGERHRAFIKERGLAAWIDRVDGDKLTVTLFSSDPASLQALFKVEGIDPAVWAKERHRLSVAVANEHLRTYNPPTNNKWATVLELQRSPTDCFGCSGVRLVLQPELMLEGFRKGRNVRLFPASWPIEAMPFGEGLHAGSHDEEPADAKELVAADFPYRTDFGNENLPWYEIQPGRFPPDHSEHRVGGELVKVDAARRSGQFRTDRTGELVNFTLPPFGSVLSLDADAELEDLPLGSRCLFFLYKDEKGAFTRAGVVEDEYSYLAGNTLTYRLETANLGEGKLVAARHAAPVKVDYILEPRVSPDFGRAELEVDSATRVWKGDHPVKLSDLTVGDELLVNLGVRTATGRGRCTDIWAGAEAQGIATALQRKRHAIFVKESGVSGWIDSVAGNEITVTLFAGSRPDMAAILGSDPYGKSVRVMLADEMRSTKGSKANQCGFKTHLPEGDTVATYGCSGVRWVLICDKLPAGYRKGGIVRLFKEEWPLQASTPEIKAHP